MSVGNFALRKVFIDMQTAFKIIQSSVFWFIVHLLLLTCAFKNAAGGDRSSHDWCCFSCVFITRDTCHFDVWNFCSEGTKCFTCVYSSTYTFVPPCLFVDSPDLQLQRKDSRVSDKSEEVFYDFFSKTSFFCFVIHLFTLLFLCTADICGYRFAFSRMWHHIKHLHCLHSWVNVVIFLRTSSSELFSSINTVFYQLCWQFKLFDNLLVHRCKEAKLWKSRSTLPRRCHTEPGPEFNYTQTVH